MRSAVRIVLVFAVVVSLMVTKDDLGVMADIQCAQGGWMNSCPDIAPVCCFDDANEFLGCCPYMQNCDLLTDDCVAAPVPANATLKPLVDVTATMHMPTLLLVSVILGTVFFLLLILGTAFFIFWCRQWLKDRRERLALRANARLADGPSEDVVVSDSEEALFLSKVQVKADPEAAISAAASVAATKELAGGLAGLCGACRTAASATLFFPCQHISACVECAPHLRHCPQCGMVAERRKKLFLE